MDSGAELGIGIVGVGGMALWFHVPAVQRTGLARVVALCDVSSAALATAAERCPGAQTYSRYEDLLANPAVDAVIIVTSNDMHAPVALAALAAGKHVLCEKPLALTAAQAQEMEQAARASGLISGVNFSYRHDPAVRFIADLLAQGEVGPPTFLTMHYLQGYLSDPQLPASWRRQRRHAGSGVLGDLGSHLIDLARYWVGEISQVAAHTRTFTAQRPDGHGGMAAVDTDDAFSFACDFATGAMGVLASTGNATGHHNHQRVEIYGPLGALIYDNTDQGAITALLGRAAARHGLFGRLAVPARYRETPDDNVAAFVRGIVAGQPMTPSFTDGLRCQQVLDAALHSAQSGRRVAVETGGPH